MGGGGWMTSLARSPSAPTALTTTAAQRSQVPSFAANVPRAVVRTTFLVDFEVAELVAVTRTRSPAWKRSPWICRGSRFTSFSAGAAVAPPWAEAAAPATRAAAASRNAQALVIRCISAESVCPR